LQTLCYIHPQGFGVGERVKLNFKRIVDFKRIVVQSVWVSSIALISSAPAYAQSRARSAAQCGEKQKQMQQLEQAGHLREAKGMALECAQDVCGELISQQCRTRHQLLEEEMPSIVPTAVDEQGKPLLEVEVRVDGTLLTTHIDGQGLTLDPGLHEFSFSAQNRVPAVEKLLIVQGERNRRISVVLRSASNQPSPSADAAPASAPQAAAPAAAPAAPQPVVMQTAVEPHRHVSGWTYVVGGVGVASLGASIALATWGHTDFQLLDECSPNCKQESVDHVRHLYIAADVTLIAGVVSLGVATWLYFSTPVTAEPRADQALNSFDLRPAPGGAFATWEHAF
jgi:hypothetical protein